MRVIIAGSRNVTSPYLISAAIQLSGLDVDTVISGGARGVDRMGEVWAKFNEKNLEVYPAEWDKYGKSAGYRRNVDMANAADALIAIWDGVSKGTKHMIDIAKSRKLIVYVMIVQEEKHNYEA